MDELYGRADDARAFHILSRIWHELREYFGDRGMHMPHFVSKAPEAAAGGTAPAWVGAWYDKDGKPWGIGWTKEFQKALLDKRHPNHQYALYAAVHEMAHTMQPVHKFYDQGRNPDHEKLTEGGAHAFAQLTAAQVYKRLGMKYKLPAWLRDTPMWKQAEAVLAERGQDWVLRGQFVDEEAPVGDSSGSP